MSKIILDYNYNWRPDDRTNLIAGYQVEVYKMRGVKGWGYAIYKVNDVVFAVGQDGIPNKRMAKKLAILRLKNILWYGA